MADELNRDWIVAGLLGDIGAEQALADLSRSRRESPPDAALGPLYGEMAAADERHRAIVETIAIRYGHTPSRGAPGGLGEAITRLRTHLAELRTSAIERVEDDLQAKAHAIHRYSAWIAAFEALGDAESAREIAAILTEETAHRDALLRGLERLFQQHAGVGPTRRGP